MKISGAALTKRALIDKTNTTIVIIAAVAAFIVVFSLVASRAFFNQATYQNRIISEKKKTLSTLNANLNARNDLVKSYDAFISTSKNVINGNTSGNEERDGDNAKIILDALPSKYDFPALISSLEKLAGAQGVQIEGINGTDDELAQQGSQASSSPAPVPLQFEISVAGAYPQIQGFIDSFEQSIRPMQIQSMSITSNTGNMSAKIIAQTFYQPEKKLELGSKVIK